MLSRRRFIQQTSFTTAALLAGKFAAADEVTMQRLVILHTNDVHSRLDPFPMDGSRNEGLGGVAARANLINEIRAKEEYVLLGRGETPIAEAIKVLSKGGYKGYYSFEWEKLWHPEIQEPEIAIPHFSKNFSKFWQ